MLIYQAARKALIGRGKITRAIARWSFSYLDIWSFPIVLVSERTGFREVWNPIVNDLLADDWKVI